MTSMQRLLPSRSLPVSRRSSTLPTGTGTGTGHGNGSRAAARNITGRMEPAKKDPALSGSR